MPREPKVVDIDPVSRAPLYRRVLLLILLAVIAGAIWISYTRERMAQAPPAPAEAAEVRSTVVPQGDSLEVAVNWELTRDSARVSPESVRVEVGLANGNQASVSTQPADRSSDTLRVAAPAPGETVAGYSCVAPIHRGQLRRETCTPWQFVLPSADTAPRPAQDTAARPPRRRTTATRAPGVSRIVIQPGGLQVDPDPDGRCASWQRQNPGRSVWLEVNQRAVPDCTGINGKPMVAQFCAFALLDDGRRVKTANSSDNPYCDRLFQEWASERVS
ncbi:MAG TPA: hypothetical protein VMN37_08955 [Gemmatimonadales bacterium]|nr:hypothetical protein [Gemmatimonadales bacterium]